MGGDTLKCLKWFCTRNSPALSVTSLTFGTWLVHTKAQAFSCYGFGTRHNEFLLTGFPPHQTLVYITLCSTCVIGEMKYIINSKYRAYKDLQNDTKNMYVWQGTRYLWLHKGNFQHKKTFWENACQSSDIRHCWLLCQIFFMFSFQTHLYSTNTHTRKEGNWTVSCTSFCSGDSVRK